MLTVIVPADSCDLTTLAAVKAELGISDHESDQNLSTWIAQASSAIIGYLNRTLGRETVRETFRLADRGSVLLLSRYPVAAIHSVTENDVTLSATDYELYNPNTGLLARFTDDAPSTWPQGKIAVEYTAGFDLPADAPADIERACILMVKQYWHGAGRDPFVRTRDVPGVMSTTYGTEGSAEIEDLLMPYRKPAG